VGRDELSALLEALNEESLPWFLKDSDTRADLCEAIFDERLRLPLSIAQMGSDPGEVRFVAVYELGAPIRSVLLLPAYFADVANVPSAGLSCVARSWPLHPELINVDGPLSKVPDGLGQSIFIFAHAPATGWDPANLSKTLYSLAGVRFGGSSTPADPPKWMSQGRFEFQANGLGRHTSMLTGGMLQEVLSETRIKWRFVSLYRIFESAYLVGLKEKITGDFLDRPSQVLSEASAALESELKTFQKLVETRQLEDFFESIRVFVDGDSTNKFLSALKRPQRGKKTPSGWRQGVSYTYRIRCAIVHGGQDDIVFDRYADGEAALKSLLDVLENAVLSLLGFTP
jgi:hypothetical protein